MIFEQNAKYKAVITLNAGLAFFASKSAIERKLKSVGFINVEVEGSGMQYTATGTWGMPTKEASVPDYVSSIQKI